MQVTVEGVSVWAVRRMCFVYEDPTAVHPQRSSKCIYIFFFVFPESVFVLGACGIKEISFFSYFYAYFVFYVCF